MVRDGWQFTAPPFAGGTEPAVFHPGAPQDEALARLEWLLAERQRLGLVVGEDGVGKSAVLAMARRRLGGLGCEVALLSLGGLGDDDWLELLLDRLPLEPEARAEPSRPWRKLEDRLHENLLMERTTVIACDDGECAPTAALEGLARLVTAAEPCFGRVLVVLATTPAGLERLPPALRHRAAVRIELAPWDEADVAAFLAGALTRVGGDPAIFSPAAVATLWRFTGGVPGTVRRVASLALVAADAEGADRIAAATVERVWRELIPDGADAPRATHAGGGDPAPGSGFRVVRRLGD